MSRPPDMRRKKTTEPGSHLIFAGVFLVACAALLGLAFALLALGEINVGTH